MIDRTERVERRLKNCFELALPQIEASRLTASTSDTVEGWDSVATLMLVSTVEEEFGISVGFDRLAELTSYAAFRDYLVQKLGA
jgi:acyl carrier protein